MIDKILGALLGFGVASAVSSKKYAKGGSTYAEGVTKDIDNYLSAFTQEEIENEYFPEFDEDFPRHIQVVVPMSQQKEVEEMLKKAFPTRDFSLHISHPKDPNGKKLAQVEIFADPKDFDNIKLVRDYGIKNKKAFVRIED